MLIINSIIFYFQMLEFYKHSFECRRNIILINEVWSYQNERCTVILSKLLVSDSGPQSTHSFLAKIVLVSVYFFFFKLLNEKRDTWSINIRKINRKIAQNRMKILYFSLFFFKFSVGKCLFIVSFYYKSSCFQTLHFCLLRGESTI